MKGPDGKGTRVMMRGEEGGRGGRGAKGARGKVVSGKREEG